MPGPGPIVVEVARLPNHIPLRARLLAAQSGKTLLLPRAVRLALALLLAVSLVPPPAAAEGAPGPVPATVLSVYDGDTIRVEAHPWPSLTMRTAVRIAGIDAPELRGKCPAEVAAASAARAALELLVADAGGTVALFDVRPDKYGGRVLARVEAGGRDLAATLIARGHGRPYDGGRRRPWCP